MTAVCGSSQPRGLCDVCLTDASYLQRHIPSLTDTLISVLEDRGGRIWVGRPSGVYVLNPESLDEMAHLGSFTVRKLDDLARVRSS